MNNYAQRLKTNSRSLRRKSTPQEIKLWAHLKSRNFSNLKFRRQHVIDKYIVDFICLEKKLIIELDGSQHKREKDTKYDAKRNAYLENLGFTVLRFWNNEVDANLPGVIIKIEDVLGFSSPSREKMSAGQMRVNKKRQRISPLPITSVYFFIK